MSDWTCVDGVGIMTCDEFLSVASRVAEALGIVVGEKERNQGLPQYIWSEEQFTEVVKTMEECF